MKTHIEISGGNLLHNLNLFNQLSGKEMIFVVKANAYGHGLRQIVELSRHLPFIKYYAVDSCAEAGIVAEAAGGKKILIIGWADDGELAEIIGEGFEFVVPSTDYLKRAKSIARRVGRPALVHLKLDTGTTRLGMTDREVLKICDQDDGKIDIRAIYSHFANIEDTTDHSYARSQLAKYTEVISRLRRDRVLKHFSCSASSLLFPETHFDIIRVGISAYGYWPSKQTYISYIEKNQEKIELKPVLTWVSKVAQVKSIDRGQYIGYGLTYQSFNRAVVVVVPVGYYDGYDRKLSNLSNIIINGAKAPVRGRVCMNMIMAEATHIKRVKEGDRVILLGRDRDGEIDADYLAELAGTINYEFLSRINPMIPREVVP
jgi:alanine racemase